MDNKHIQEMVADMKTCDLSENIKRIIETLEKQRLSYIRRSLSRDSEESAYFRGTKKLSELVIISLKSALDYSKK